MMILSATVENTALRLIRLQEICLVLSLMLHGIILKLPRELLGISAVELTPYQAGMIWKTPYQGESDSGLASGSQLENLFTSSSLELNMISSLQ